MPAFSSIRRYRCLSLRFFNKQSADRSRRTSKATKPKKVVKTRSRKRSAKVAKGATQGPWRAAAATVGQVSSVTKTLESSKPQQPNLDCSIDCTKDDCAAHTGARL